MSAAQNQSDSCLQDGRVDLQEQRIKVIHSLSQTRLRLLSEDAQPDSAPVMQVNPSVWVAGSISSDSLETRYNQSVFRLFDSLTVWPSGLLLPLDLARRSEIAAMTIISLVRRLDTAHQCELVMSRGCRAQRAETLF